MWLSRVTTLTENAIDGYYDETDQPIILNKTEPLHGKRMYDCSIFRIFYLSSLQFKERFAKIKLDRSCTSTRPWWKKSSCFVLKLSLKSKRVIRQMANYCNFCRSSNCFLARKATFCDREKVCMYKVPNSLFTGTIAVKRCDLKVWILGKIHSAIGSSGFSCMDVG